MTVDLRILERVDVPASLDVVERASWARMDWRVGRASATRIRREESERQTIAIPAASIAAWMLENWWSLLYELAPAGAEGISAPWQSLDAASEGWRVRHSMRTADSGLFLPDLRICSNGPAVTWSLRPDMAQGARSVCFLDEAEVVTDRSVAIRVMGDFVGWNLEALRDCHADAADWLRARWDAVLTATNLDAGEFCRAAGRMGLDPHDTSDWPAHLLDWMTAAPPGTLDSAFSVDLLNFAGSVDDLPGVHAALSQLVEKYQLGGSVVPLQWGEPPATGAGQAAPPFTIGYERAERLRRQAKFADEQPVEDLARVVHDGVGLAFKSADASLVGPFAAVTGWANGSPWVISRRTGAARRRTKRFSLARGLFLALWSSDRGPRVASDAKDRDQQAARAFAAELLAPRRIVEQRVDAFRRDRPLDEAFADVADEFDVDEPVVVHQYRNASEGR